MEEFFPISDFDGYFINKNGEILSKIIYKEGRLLKPFLRPDGYYRICLYKDNEQKFLLVHRILALMFIPNSENLPYVDHIDRCTTNNKLENLRWVSKELNNQNKTRQKDNKIGHKNISLKVIKKKDGKDYPYYKFTIVRNGKTHEKLFKKLEESIKYRNEYITALGEEIID